MSETTIFLEMFLLVIFHSLSQCVLLYVCFRLQECYFDLTFVINEALKRLVDGFQYENNPGLCGSFFPSLRSCNALDNVDPIRPEPYGGDSTGLPTRDIPETANLNLNCTNGQCLKSSRTSPASVAVGVVVFQLSCQP